LRAVAVPSLFPSPVAEVDEEREEEDFTSLRLSAMAACKRASSSSSSPKEMCSETILLHLSLEGRVAPPLGTGYDADNEDDDEEMVLTAER
jgi:hypothetical protein